MMNLHDTLETLQKKLAVDDENFSLIVEKVFEGFALWFDGNGVYFLMDANGKAYDRGKMYTKNTNGLPEVDEPWKPEEEEGYRYWCIALSEWRVTQKAWRPNVCDEDVPRWEAGNCFKTVKDAEAGFDEFISKIQRQRYE